MPSYPDGENQGLHHSFAWLLNVMNCFDGVIQMEQIPALNYFRIKQIYKIWGLERRQLLFEIEKHRINVSIGLAFKTGRLNQGTVRVYKEKIHNLTGEVIKEYIPHNGYVELYDDSFMDPRKSLADLLNRKDALIWKIKCHGHECFLEPPISILSKDIYIHNMETSKIRMIHESTKTYKGDHINAVVVNIILPQLLPDKEIPVDINKLSWEVFKQLTNQLNTDGAKVTDNIPKENTKYNKKNCKISGIDSCGEEINLTYEALKKRIQDSLLQAYQRNISPQKDTFSD